MKRTYSKEFKMQACRLVEDEHIKVSIVAKQFGINAVMLYRWLKEIKNTTMAAESHDGISQVSN